MEDLGITLGEAMKKAVGDKKGIKTLWRVLCTDG